MACGSRLPLRRSAGAKPTNKAMWRRIGGLSDPPGEAPQYVPGAPLSLELALRLTATHNEQLAIQGERLIQALADQQRLAAALRPTLEFFANFGIEGNYRRRRPCRPMSACGGQYRLLTGQSDLRNVRAAEARAEASRWLVLDLREALLVQNGPCLLRSAARRALGRGARAFAADTARAARRCAGPKRGRFHAAARCGPDRGAGLTHPRATDPGEPIRGRCAGRPCARDECECGRRLAHRWL
jgi:hypothetical protein